MLSDNFDPKGMYVRVIFETTLLTYSYKDKSIYLLFSLLKLFMLQEDQFYKIMIF